MTVPANGPGHNDLRGLLETLPRGLYAVADGGFFNDLPKYLKRAGLISRPLYLEGDGSAGVAAGPHLVDLTSDSAIPAFLDLLDGTAAAVFWVWEGKEADLYRHLRRLNLAEIPVDPEDRIGNQRWDTVLLRHGDPNVMAALLPVLRPDQLARLYGPARALVYHAPHLAFATADGTGLFHAPRPADLPEAPRGLLRLDDDQVQALTDNRLIASRGKIMDYLRDVAEDETARMDNAALYARVVEAERVGARIGLQSEKAHGLWAFLALLTDGETLRNEEVHRQISAAPSPDEAIDGIFDDVEDMSDGDL